LAKRRVLLNSASATALLASAGAALPGHALAGSFRSLGQALSAGAGASAAASANAAATKAARQAGLGAQNVAIAAARFRSLNQALAGMGYDGQPIPNGIAPGGLQQAPGVAGGSNSTLWSGASSTLTQTLSNGVTDVTVTQTGAVASLNWQSFNVGAKTHLIFNQSAGGSLASNWVAINSIQDPSANPTTILGEISAPGKIFILNPNGVLFGAGSQVNVGALVAATASIAQAQLTHDTNGLINGFSLYGTIDSSNAITPTFIDAPAAGSVVVQPGAAITTNAATGAQSGGYVMLLADSVSNAGVIATPHGQTILAAGTNFFLQPGYSTSNPTATVIGSEVAVTNSGSGTTLGTLGLAVNSGIVLADQGDITMVGHQVVQDGILLATTTVDTRGTVHLLTDTSDATSSVTLAADSVTEILPEDDGATALDSQRAANLAASITDNAARLAPTAAVLNDYNTLADTLGESRIEMSTGGSVTMQGGALALAQGGQVAVAAGQSVAIASGATIDVSGTQAVLPSSANSLFIQGIVPYYLRDSAANRTGGLEFTNVSIDERTLVEIASGAYAGNIYTAGGLLEVSGNLGLVPHGIEEWSSLAGQVTLQSATSVDGTLVGGTITLAQGSTINLTGGTVTYDAGLVAQSYVQAEDGEIYNINNAPGDLVYTGVYTGVAAVHPRWHITQNFDNPLLTPAEIYEPSYTIGRDAGSLTIAAASGAIGGTIDAGVTIGSAQTGARPTGITDPFLLAQSVSPLSGSLESGIYEGGSQYGTFAGSLFLSNVLITGSAPVAPGLLSALPETVAGTLTVDGNTLNADGLANITLYTAGGIAVAAPVVAANGGTVTLGAQVIEDAASITAHGGSIVLTNLLPSSSATIASPISQIPGNIVVAGGVVLDASGTWTNLQRDASDTSAEGYAAGGSVLIQGTGPVDLAAGSVLDVSSGGVLSDVGKLIAEAGGNIAVSADIVPLDFASLDLNGPVTYAAQFDGYASGAGGTLSLEAPVFLLGGLVPIQASTVALDSSVFASGFGDYVVNGAVGLTVGDGGQITVTRPVYTLADGNVATGAAASEAYAITLPSLFVQAKGGDTLVQRAGASLSLDSSVAPGFYNGGGSNVTIGTGASVTVDPRQSITLAGYGQVTVLGTLTAHGGTITAANTRYELAATDPSHENPSNYQDNLSVWIGDGALVDASGVATIMTDALGRSFGQGQAGGSIVLGGLGGTNAASQESTYAQVILRPGGSLNVAGASATVDVVPNTEAPDTSISASPTVLSGAGGTIVTRSYDGIALDGTMLASGAGPGAAGGTLIMRLDPESLNALYGLPASYYVASQILITQNAVAVQPGSGIAPGDPESAYTLRLGRISQQQIDQAGFDSLNLYAQDQIVFQGNVDLNVGRSLVLASTTIGETEPGAAVKVTVPYLSLFGYSPGAQGGYDQDGPANLLPFPTNATLAFDADFIDITNVLDLGGIRVVGSPDATAGGTPQGTFSAASYGFSNTLFDSAGDIRFDQATAPQLGATILSSAGNIVLQGQQLYPATGAVATVIAGDTPDPKAGANPLAGGNLTVLGQGGAAPQAPYSVGGTLSLIADDVFQDGVIRAPEGQITLGMQRGDGLVQPYTDLVALGDGSVTSVSLAGQTIPYGGTVDGVNYLYDGATPLTFTPIVQIASADVVVDNGATIDLRGGGTLTGAGFIAGRGGSADVNKTPLLSTGNGSVTAGGSDPVFAIVPGYSSDYAPVAPGDSGYGAPSQGQQITIGAGEVPGLAAGTYTLLPAYYDLLPGAYRIELTSAPAATGASGAFGNFTTEAAVTVGTANTTIAGATPTEALITSGAGVRQLSQYDEESYNSFEQAQATTFNAPRPLLPQDAKTLLIDVNTPDIMAPDDLPISIQPAALLQSAPSGGYGATLEIAAQNPIEILAPGEPTLPAMVTNASGSLVATPAFGISADMLSALDLPRLVIGGTLTASLSQANLEDIQGVAPAIVVAGGAHLTAGDIMLTADESGSITVQTGATLTTLGAPDTAYGLSQGIYFNSDNTNSNTGANPVLALSNSQIVFTPNALTAFGASITIDAGATLLAGASLNFNAPQGSSVQIGDANLRASDVVVQVADIDIGSTRALADFATLLPQGLTLDTATLNTLAQGASELTLTANEAVNIVGSVALDSGTTDLVLNAPAIYGYGVSTTANGSTTVSDAGAISITAPRFTWSGVSSFATLQTGSLSAVSATPGGQLAGSVATAAGTETLTNAAGLTVTAGTIVLGYGPSVQVNDQVVLDRLAIGFGAVTLQASADITANNQSSLSVFATQSVYGQAGTGGDLTLSSPLITAASGAVLSLTAGDTLTASNPGTMQAATGTISTLGATIDLTADIVQTSTSFALPSGKLAINAADAIDLNAGTAIDLSGRAVKLFDQTAYSTGGTLALAAAAANAGSIMQDAGASIDVSSPGANAGSISAIAAGGAVTFDGTLGGSAVGGKQGGDFTIAALALPDFDALNTILDTGGFTGARNFEAATGNITVDGTIAAHIVTIAADTGALDVSGTIDASGSTPGSIALSAGTMLTLESAAILDAQATKKSVDSYGIGIDAENTAHVTLTSLGAPTGNSLTGSVVLDPGATIDIGYFASLGHRLGQLVINAPRAGADGVAVSAPGSLTITGAASIALNAFQLYSPTDPLGTIVQDNGTNSAIANGTLGIVQIGMDNLAYMTAVDANGAALATQLAGLAAYGGLFHLRPGVLIESSTASNGNLTISGDLDLSGLRYADPKQFGFQINPNQDGSGEPGAIVFRAAGDLTINGSVSDGFAAPPDETSGTPLTADTNGWKYLQQSFIGGEITNADLLLPAGAVGLAGQKSSTSIVLLAATPNDGFVGTDFDTTRPISLNYGIVINQALLNANVVIPFALTLGTPSTPIPAGGWVATASVTRGGITLFAKGAVIPAGYVFNAGDVFAPGTVLPINVSTGVTAGTDPNTGAAYQGQVVPAGTPFTVFSDYIITLSEQTGVLPVNALIPSNTYAVFGGVVAGSDNPFTVSTLNLRQTQDIGGNQVQGYLYPLAQMLAAGTQSWSLGFVAGANLDGGNLQAVQPLSTLTGSVFAATGGMTNQAPGSILLDDQHYYANTGNDGNPSLAFSVIRTGTGDLSLVAGGDIDQSSLYGIYTAGTQSPLPSGENAQFDSGRVDYGGTYLLPGKTNEAASLLISSTYQAYYPNDGGDVLFAAQGDVTGDIYATTNTGIAGIGTPASDAIGNWLWRQGSTQLGQPTSWWINFGTLVQPLYSGGVQDLPVQMVGFQGIGALGGGNVTVDIGGNAGQTTDRDEGGAGAAVQGATTQRGEGLIIAVGSTGRLLPGATTPVETGGGDINVTIGGTLNPIDAASYAIGASPSGQSTEPPAVNGDIIDVRGDIAVSASAIGRIDPVYNAAATALSDPRALDPFTSEDGIPNGGIEVAPGDGTADITTLRDLVLAGAVDPGRVALQNLTRINPYRAILKRADDTGGDSGFTLWQPDTTISLFSDGGNVTPTTVPNEQTTSLAFSNDAPTDYRSIYPPSLLVTAATGSIIYGQYDLTPAQIDAEGQFGNPVEASLETMPAPNGQISFLAGQSISANFYTVDISGANPLGLALPTDPAFTSAVGDTKAFTNILTGLETNQSPLALFALEADTPSTDVHQNDPEPARFYAAGGDILDFQTGETLSFLNVGANNATSVAATWYIAAKPVWILASQDIVSSGTRPAADPNSAIFAVQENQVLEQNLGASQNFAEYSSGNLFLNTGAQSISVIQAGRDILSTFAYIGGPGLLDVQAGRDLYQASALNIAGTGQVLSFGAFKSLGDDLITGSPISLSAGAGISVAAGVGATGPDVTSFADLYFNPANQANLSLPLTDAANNGKVQQVYAAQLLAWLTQNYGYTGGQDGVLAAFLALPTVDQGVFVRAVYFDELNAAGLQYNDPTSRFYKSYARGRTAIDTLFPSNPPGTAGVPAGYTGGITMYSGTVLTDAGTASTPLTMPSGGVATFDGGIATLFGGTVQVLDPGGNAVFGVPGGPAPGNNSGIVTYGSGDIDIYSLGNVLLGKSRIFTTAGGNILIWSSDGDINAGIGAKTTQVYSPPVLVYDALGDITDTPPAVTTGAGIATLQPLPNIPPGDVSLIAPLGVVDAGEAGIRATGNVNIVGPLANGANIQAGGKVVGTPTIASASLGAVEAAGAAAGSATSTAQNQGQRNSGAGDAASVLDVEVISIGGTYDEEQKRKRRL
jgi:filamentous hemagglutinin family protein